MTTDLVKYREDWKASTPSAGLLFRHVFGKARTSGDTKGFHENRFQQEDQQDDQQDEVQRLAQRLDLYDLEKEGWQRSMSATVALLKYAQKMIDEAEQKLARQNNRIAQLETLATTDELTGLVNRRGFFESFIRELDKCERCISSGGLLVLIDLDNFKAINDTHGHMAGDSCLRLVARTLEAEIRTMDVAARLGGDEFVLLLSNTTKCEAAERAQDIAWQLNNLALAWYGDEIPVRASLGLKAYGKGDSAEKIFNAADMRMYASKRHKGQRGSQSMPA